MTESNKLIHYGVKGMRWGVRRSPAELSRGSDDFERKQAINRQAKTLGTHTVSNAELRAAIERMNLEMQYSRLTMTDSQKATKFVTDMMSNFGKQTVNALVGGELRKASGMILKRRSPKETA